MNEQQKALLANARESLDDYEVNVEVSAGLAGEQIANAQRFMDFVQNMLASTTGKPL